MGLLPIIFGRKNLGNRSQGFHSRCLWEHQTRESFPKTSREVGKWGRNLTKDFMHKLFGNIVRSPQEWFPWSTWLQSKMFCKYIWYILIIIFHLSGRHSWPLLASMLLPDYMVWIVMDGPLNKTFNFLLLQKKMCMEPIWRDHPTKVIW